jgi:hypothetical protein
MSIVCSYVRPTIGKRIRVIQTACQKTELLSNVVYGALGSVPHFLYTINESYSTDYLS